MAIRLKFTADTQKAERNVKSLERSVESIDKTTTGAAKSAKELTRSFLSIATAAIAIRGAAKNLDQFTRVGNRIALTTGRTKALVAQQRKLLEVSKASRSDFEKTVALYSKLALNTKLSNQEALKLTATLQKAAIIGGGDSNTTAGAITQLTQGLASGVLRGEELNSVLEGLPRVAQAIAKELDIDIGKMRELAKEGKITSLAVSKALKNSATAISSEFKQLNNTIGQSLSVAASDISFGLNRVFTSFNRGSGGVGKFIENMGKSVSSVLRDVAVSIRVLQTDMLLFKYDFKDLMDYIAGFSAAGIFGSMLNGVSSFSGVLAKAIKPIENFVDKVESLFFNMYMYVIGNSVYKDMINNIVAYTPNLFKALETVKAFGGAIGDVFDGLVNSTKKGIQFGLSAGNTFLGTLAQGLAGVISIALLAVPFSRIFLSGGVGVTIGQKIAAGFLVVAGAAFADFAFRENKGDKEGLTGLLSEQNNVLNFILEFTQTISETLSGFLPGGTLIESFKTGAKFIADNLAAVLITALAAKPLLKAFGALGQSLNPLALTGGIASTVAQTLGDVQQRRTAGPRVRELRAFDEQLKAELGGVNESFRNQNIEMKKAINNARGDEDLQQILRLEREVAQDNHNKKINKIQGQMAANQKKLAVNSQLLDGAVTRLRATVEKSILGFGRVGGALGGLLGNFLGAGLGAKIAKDWGMNAAESFITVLLVSQVGSIILAGIMQAAFQGIAVLITGMIGGLFSAAAIIPVLIASGVAYAVYEALQDDSWARRAATTMAETFWDWKTYFEDTSFIQMGKDMAQAFWDHLKSIFSMEDGFSANLLSLMLLMINKREVPDLKGSGDIEETTSGVSAGTSTKANLRQDQIISSILESMLAELKLSNSVVANGESPKIRGFSTGGSVFGGGTATSDSIPAMLSNGEFVVKESVAKTNRGMLEHLNSTGSVPGFKDGGIVGFFQDYKERLEAENPSDRNSLFNFSGINYSQRLGQFSIDELTTPEHESLVELLSISANDPNLTNTSLTEGYYQAVESFARRLSEMYTEANWFNAIVVAYLKEGDALSASATAVPKFPGTDIMSPENAEFFNRKDVTIAQSTLLQRFQAALGSGELAPDKQVSKPGAAIDLEVPGVSGDFKMPLNTRNQVIKSYMIALHEIGHAFDYFKHHINDENPTKTGFQIDLLPKINEGSFWPIIEEIPKDSQSGYYWSGSSTNLNDHGEGYASVFASQMFGDVSNENTKRLFGHATRGSLLSYLLADIEEGFVIRDSLPDNRKQDELTEAQSWWADPDYWHSPLETKQDLAKFFGWIGYPDLMDIFADGHFDGMTQFDDVAKLMLQKLHIFTLYSSEAARAKSNSYGEGALVETVNGESIPDKSLNAQLADYYGFKKAANAARDDLDSFIQTLLDPGKGYANGGSVFGDGTSTSDSIPAMLSNGEFVVKESVAKKNRGMLEYLNSTGNIPRFAEGGSVGSGDAVFGYTVEDFKGIAQPILDKLSELIEPIKQLILDGVNNITGGLGGESTDGIKSIPELVGKLLPILNSDGISVNANILSGYLDDNPKDAKRANQLQASLERVSERIKSIETSGSEVPLALKLQKKILEDDILTELGAIVEAIEEGNVLAEYSARQVAAGQSLLDGTKSSLSGGLSDVLRGRASPEEALKGIFNTFMDSAIENISTSFIEGLFTDSEGKDNILGSSISSLGTGTAKASEDAGRGLFGLFGGSGDDGLPPGIAGPMLTDGLAPDGLAMKPGASPALPLYTQEVSAGLTGLAGPMLTDGLEPPPLPPGIAGPVEDALDPAAATKPITDTLWNTTKSLLSDGFGGLGDVFGNLMGSLGNMLGGMGGGGTAGLIGMGVGLIAGLFDNGGSVPSNKFGIVGERGPELVSGPATVYNRAKTARELDAAGRGGSGNVTFALEGDFDSRAERSIRNMVNSGMMQSALNGAEVENGGSQPIFRTP